MNGKAFYSFLKKYNYSTSPCWIYDDYSQHAQFTWMFLIITRVVRKLPNISKGGVDVIVTITTIWQSFLDP